MPVKTSDFKTHQQTVEHNGFRFWFNTYDNEYLRSLQFFFIESELKQAIGRARVNTELCTVEVYSNYPLPEACVTLEEKESGLERFKNISKSQLDNVKADLEQYFGQFRC